MVADKQLARKGRNSLFFLCLLLISGCRDDLSDSIHIHLGSDILSLNPATNTMAASAIVFRQIYEGLASFDRDGKVQPRGAVSWEGSPDARQWKVRLREGALWSDGTPIVAKDYVDGLKNILTHGYELMDEFYSIRGVRGFAEGKTGFEAIGVRAVTPTQLEIDLDTADRHFEEFLASGFWVPFREGLSNGPFVLKEWRKDQWIDLIPNTRYWGKQPKTPLRFVVVPELNTAFILFETGKLDVLEQIPPLSMNQLAKDPRFKRFPDPSVYYVAFNTRHRLFSDAKTRCFFSRSFDPKEVLEVLQGPSQVAHRFVHPLLMPLEGADEVSHVLKPEELKAQWANVMHRPWDMDHRLDIELGFNTHERHALLMERLKFVLESRMPVRIVLRNEEWKGYLSRLKSDPPALYRFAQLAPFPSALALLSVFEWPGRGANFMKWENKEYQSYLKKSRDLANPEEQAVQLRKADDLLVNRECVVMPIYFYERTVLISPRVSGVEYGLQGLLPVFDGKVK